MLVSLEEAKKYLRVDYEDDDSLILQLITSAQKICMDVARIEDVLLFETESENSKIAVLFTLAYLYEHREEADHHELELTLRALLFGIRQESF